jgi:hypothetical protein
VKRVKMGWLKRLRRLKADKPVGKGCPFIFKFTLEADGEPPFIVKLGETHLPRFTGITNEASFP